MNLVIKTIKAFAKLIMGFIVCPILYLIPRDGKKAVFGAWKGFQFSDNPKYLMIYALEHSSLKCYWIGHDCVKEQVELIDGAVFLRKGSMRALFHFLTAKFLICNVAFHEDLCKAPMCGKVMRINLWHGIPFKKIGCAQLDGKGEDLSSYSSGIRAKFSKINIFIRRYLYPMMACTSASSLDMKNIFCDCFPAIFRRGNVWEYGTPRIDYLINNAGNRLLKEEIRAKLEKRFGIGRFNTWYVYLPTWRHGLGDDYSFAKSKYRMEIEEILRRRNAVLIEKQHPKVLEALENANLRYDNILSLGIEESRGLDIQELLMAADCLITDYSSCFFDFETMRRPVVHFAYDYERYRTNDSGCVYEIEDIAAGPVAYTEESLMDCLKMPLAELLKRTGENRLLPLAWERGVASKNILKMMGVNQNSVH